jgi:hypothetical protein
MGNRGENPVFFCMLTSTKIDARGSQYLPQEQNTLIHTHTHKLRILMVLLVLADKRKIKPLVILKRAIVS